MSVEIVFDNSSLILQIDGGEGGADSKLFAHDLADAYRRYASLRGFSCSVLNESNGHIEFKINGPNVWDAFKNESGKHIVQRVSPTESNGRRHTSVVTVAVLSVFENEKFVLHEKDLEIILQNGRQGAGGQNVNKRKTCVVATHVPTNIKVVINGREQGENKRIALETLTKRVGDFYKQKKVEEYNSNKKTTLMGNGDKIGGRGDKVRTYNFMRGEIEDHVLNRKTNDVKSFMKGRFTVLFGE